MAKKQKREHKAKGEKSKEMQKTSGKGKEGEYVIETSRTVSGIRAFIDRFKSDVEKKRRAFKSFSLMPHRKER